MHTSTMELTSSLKSTANARVIEKRLFLFALIALDLLMITLGFWIAYVLRFELDISWFYQHDVSLLLIYRRLVFLFAPILVAVFWVFSLYDFKNLFRGMNEYMQIFNAGTLGIMLLIISTFFFDPDFAIARAWVIMSWLLVISFVAMGRFVFRRVVQWMRINGRLLTRVLIIGANNEAVAVAKQLNANPRTGISIVGFVADDKELGSELLPGIPLVGSFSSVSALVKKYDIQEVIVSATALPRERLLSLFQTFGVSDGITIRLSSGLYEILTTGVEVQEIGNVPLLSINRVRLTGGDVVLKRALDIAVSFVALLLLLPVMAVIAIAVWLDSRGPIIHKRRVVGVGGKTFDAYKFRTMYVNGDEILARNPELKRELEENQKLKNDPRVTRLGRKLRPTSLDELPQLFNVLRGQMSLVGPRMITEQERRLYGKWRTNLLTVKPGITGLWQVSGRSNLNYSERVALDMHYIRNHSIWFDLYLLWLTIPAVFKKRGAY